MALDNKLLIQRVREITAYTDEFCQDVWNGQNRQVCHRVIEVLAEHPQRPLAVGNVYLWAAAILFVVDLNCVDVKAESCGRLVPKYTTFFKVKKIALYQKADLVKQLLAEHFFAPAPESDAMVASGMAN